MAPKPPRPVKPPSVPPLSFWVGGLLGVSFCLPLLSLGLHELAVRAGIGDPDVAVERIARVALVFAGLPALLSGGGVARMVAYRAAHRAPASASIGRSALLGALGMGAAGIGLVYLIAVPLGGMPELPERWAPLAGVGLGAGLVTGVAIGLLTGLRQRRRAAKVTTAEVPS